MPLSTYKKLTNERPAETDIRLSLAIHSYIYPLGIAEDVLVDVIGYVYPVDFVILDIKDDEKRPFILGTPFLTTAKAVIKFDKGTITLRSGKSKMSFHRIPESLYKIEKGIKNDIEPIAPTMTVNRLVSEWEERIKLHQEKEMEFDQWRSKIFKNKHPALVKVIFDEKKLGKNCAYKAWRRCRKLQAMASGFSKRRHHRFDDGVRTFQSVPGQPRPMLLVGVLRRICLMYRVMMSYPLEVTRARKTLLLLMLKLQAKKTKDVMDGYVDTPSRNVDHPQSSIGVDPFAVGPSSTAPGIAGDDIERDFFPFVHVPTRLTIRMGGLIELFKDLSVCKAVVDYFPTSTEVVRVETLTDEQLTKKIMDPKRTTHNYSESGGRSDGMTPMMVKILESPRLSLKNFKTCFLLSSRKLAIASRTDGIEMTDEVVTTIMRAMLVKEMSVTTLEMAATTTMETDAHTRSLCDASRMSLMAREERWRTLGGSRR
ncbi:MAK10-like protein [Tanacetum coccineum]